MAIDSYRREIPVQSDASLLDIAAVLLQRWKRIAIITVSLAVLLLLYGLVQTKLYTSRIVLVPSSSGGGDARAQALASQLKIPGLAALGGGGSSNSQMIVQAIMKSNSLRDSVIERIQKAPGTPHPDRPALQHMLDEGTSVESDPLTRAIAVAVTAPDPRLAAAIAGAIPEVVNSIAAQLSLQAAVRRREALEKQLEDARNKLSASEERLRTFQEQHGIPEIQEQARQTVGAFADLQQKVSEQEVKVAMLRRTTTATNPEYQSAVAELNALRQQMRTMGRGSNREDLLLSRSALPEIRLELGRLMREYTKDEQVYLSFTAELAGLQADASDDLTVVSVLDRAGIPLRPSSPRLKLLFAAGLLFGAMLGVFWAFMANYLDRARALPRYDSFFLEWERARRSMSRVPAAVVKISGQTRGANGRSLSADGSDATLSSAKEPD